MLYCAMQQHLLLLSALAVSLPSFGLCCAICVPFSELEGVGEKEKEKGNRRQRHGHLSIVY